MCGDVRPGLALVWTSVHDKWTARKPSQPSSKFARPYTSYQWISRALNISIIHGIVGYGLRILFPRIANKYSEAIIDRGYCQVPDLNSMIYDNLRGGPETNQLTTVTSTKESALSDANRPATRSEPENINLRLQWRLNSQAPHRVTFFSFQIVFMGMRVQ